MILFSKFKKQVIFSLFGLSLTGVYAQNAITDATFSVIEGRHIGPARTSGRIAAIDASDKDPNLVYVGAAGGGLWKSKNQGTTFK
ncbi:MAG TPA: hypothetical protein PLN38_04600, partial [Chitinophagales bacterium]|nr:hypothetical protein [Chitinophagales bacterium]